MIRSLAFRPIGGLFKRWFGCIALLGLVGCGNPVGPTSGIVRFTDGTPVQSGSVELRHLSNKQRFSSRIADDGSFEPMDDNGVVGVPAGNYEAVVVQIVLTEDLAKEQHLHGRTVPRKFADYYTSGLRIQVVQGQQDPIEIVIESDEKDSGKLD